jgi:hypothetical protein
MSNTELTKNFPVFDCDAHINDPLEIRDKYVQPEYRELDTASFLASEDSALMTGRVLVVDAGTVMPG